MVDFTGIIMNEQQVERVPRDEQTVKSTGNDSFIVNNYYLLPRFSISLTVFHSCTQFTQENRVSIIYLSCGPT